MNPGTIGFFLALNATPGEVDEVVQRIYDFYQIEGGGSVDPATLQGAAVTQGQVAPAAAAASDVETDSTGLPWDDRIHASTKGKNQDGTWKKRRGVDDKLVKKIEGQLRQTMSAAPAGNAELPPAPGAAAASLPPPPGSALPPPPVAKATPYIELVNFVTSKHADQGGPITDDWLAQVLTHYGVADGSLQNAAHLPADKQTEALAWIKNAVGG